MDAAAAAAAAEGAAGGGGGGGAGAGGDSETIMKAFELFKLSHNIKKMLGEERRNDAGLPVCLESYLCRPPFLFMIRMLLTTSTPRPPRKAGTSSL